MSIRKLRRVNPGKEQPLAREKAKSGPGSLRWINRRRDAPPVLFPSQACWRRPLGPILKYFLA
jgi:hypothetical protein